MTSVETIFMKKAAIILILLALAAALYSQRVAVLDYIRVWRAPAVPELPEVEVIRRGLLNHLPGRTIEAVFYSGKLLRRPVLLANMRDLLIGEVIVDITRRAKYLLIHMDSGALLLLHMGMTGRLGLFPLGVPTAKHDHLRWRLDSGLELRFHDARRFGLAQVLTPEEALVREDSIFGSTGPEPFSDQCTPTFLMDRARKKRQSVKAFLMDTRIIAGVGNIYANESLFRSGIHPARPVGDLDLHDWQLLVSNLRSILQHAIDCGGSTISDYLNAGGTQGYFQVHFRVYDRAGEPCPKCRTPIERIKIGGRASFFCPKCQTTGK